MAADGQTSTLLDSEYRLRGVTRAVSLCCCALSVVALACTWGHIHPMLLAGAAVLSLGCQLSNLHYLRTHPLPTVGMMPVAVFGLLAAAIALATAAGAPMPARRVAQVYTALATPVLLLFLSWAFRLRRCYSTHPRIASDAIVIVLGGAIRKGRPCVTLARRLDVAARLWREEPGRTLLLTGGPTYDRRTTEADAMARYLQECGVDASSLVLERRARNTQENVACSLALVERLGGQRQLCVVSSDYHLWRTLREGRALGVSLTAVAAPTPRGSIPQQWCREILTILAGR